MPFHPTLDASERCVLVKNIFISFYEKLHKTVFQKYNVQYVLFQIHYFVIVN